MNSPTNALCSDRGNSTAHHDDERQKRRTRRNGKEEKRGELVESVEEGLLYERAHINVCMRVHWR